MSLHDFGFDGEIPTVDIEEEPTFKSKIYNSNCELFTFICANPLCKRVFMSYVHGRYDKETGWFIAHDKSLGINGVINNTIAEGWLKGRRCYKCRVNTQLDNYDKIY